MRLLLARTAVAAGVVGLVLGASGGVAAAHPLGNVSVNHYAGLVVGTEDIAVDYVLDLAELPTVRERQGIDVDGDGAIDAAEQADYEDRRCGELAEGLTLRVDGSPVGVESSGGTLAFLDGTAGLQILRLECDLRADVGVTVDGTDIVFRNGNAGARGWNEVVAIGDEVTLDESSVPDSSTSSRLSAYPEQSETLDVSEASLVASPGGEPAGPLGAAPFGEQARSATDRFTSLIAADDITVPLVATSLVVAMLFGALHSLAPGHGKSVIAAYLLGQQRDRRLAFLLGGTVAVTHTASVLAFGGIVTLTETAAPESFYPLFGVVSGLLFVALGIALLRQVVQRDRHVRAHQRPSVVAAPALVPVGAGVAPRPDESHHGHDHDHHGHDHDHDHHRHDHGHGHDHDHDHDHDWHEHVHVDLGAVATGDLGWRGVILPGLAGGLVPSPSALLVFLGGLALGRAWFGVGLVLGYGVGIAATLVTAGWLLARAGDRFTDGDVLSGAPRLARIAAYLPAITAVLVVLGGLHIAVRSVV